MPRFFLKLSYDGTSFSGWQSQPNAVTVQGKIEESISILFQKEIPIVGCGRTDAGVHAQNYIAHVDLSLSYSTDDLKYKLNGLLGDYIVIDDIIEVSPQAHARFDANYRKYDYFIHTKKHPFKRDHSFFVPLLKQWDKSLLHESGALIKEYSDFFTFCKSNSDVKTTKCEIYESSWEIDVENDVWKYTVAANRFLRGMVRLLVGMQLNVAAGKIDLKDVEHALQNTERLKRDWSVPAKGLFLNEIRYNDEAHFITK